MSTQSKVLAIAALSGVAFAIWVLQVSDIEPLSLDLLVGEPLEASQDHAVSAVDNVPNELEQSDIDHSSILAAELGDSVPQGTRKLYSEANALDPGYEEASDLADEILNDLEQWSRNMVVKLDNTAAQDLVTQIESRTSDTLDSSFELSPYLDVPCVVSSIEYTLPGFTPGTDDAPVGYRAEVRCESSNTQGSILVRKDKNSFAITLRSPVWGVFAAVSLGDSGFALAYRSDRDSLGG